MSMITRIGFRIRSTSFMDTLIRPSNAQFFRQPKEWSRIQRFGDSVWNIIDEYKPVAVKGIDKATGKRITENTSTFINFHIFIFPSKLK